MNKFKLTHVALYAKGWYKQTDNVWEDLIGILKLDDYTPFDRSDVYSIIINSFQNSNLSSLREVLMGITPDNCWKVNYYTKGNVEWLKEKSKENLPEYEMETAFIYYVLSNLRFIDNTQWEIGLPKYTEYPKARHITIKKVYDTFIKV